MLIVKTFKIKQNYNRIVQTCQDAEIFKGEIFTFVNFRKTKKKKKVLDSLKRLFLHFYVIYVI